MQIQLHNGLMQIRPFCARDPAAKNPYRGRIDASVRPPPMS
jgi:hypothetical protein